MRSLHVITSDARRGAETFAVSLAGALEASNHRARVVALAPSGDPLALDVPCLGSARRSPATLAVLRRAGRSADVVVAHGSSTLEACAVALAGSTTPFVYRSIGDPSYWVAAGWSRRGVSILLRRARRVTALWPGAAERIAALHRVPDDRIDVIPNAVVEERFGFAGPEERDRARTALGLPRDAPCFAFVGALSVEKQVDRAIDAVAAVPGSTLLVVGVGALADELRGRAEVVAPGQVRFLGQVTHPRDVYAAADLLLLPSSSEGMPAVLVEAGLVGTPTVGTPVGAIPDTLTDGVTGYLSDRADREAFVERVVEALPSASQVGARAAEDFRGRYSFRRIAGLWRRTLDEAVVT